MYIDTQSIYGAGSASLSYCQRLENLDSLASTLEPGRAPETEPWQSSVRYPTPRMSDELDDPEAGDHYVSAASYQRLLKARDNLRDAAVHNAEKAERRAFREYAKEKMRERGAQLSLQRRLQLEKNAQLVAAQQSYRAEAVAVRRAQHDDERGKREEMKQRYVEQGKELTRREREQEERTRASIEAVRQEREAATIEMRTQLKALKQQVDQTTLLAKRDLVSRVRADTSDEKIRHAKIYSLNVRY